MAGDTTALAEAIAAMRATVTAADAAIMYDKVPSTIHAEARIFGAFRNEIEAGRALLAALEGVPERLALLEDLAEVACWLADSCGTTQERRDDSYATVDTYSPQAKTMLDAALDALDALDGGGPA